MAPAEPPWIKTGRRPQTAGFRRQIEIEIEIQIDPQMKGFAQMGRTHGWGKPKLF
jgi:hypothetical protein